MENENIKAFPGEVVDEYGKKHRPNLGMDLRDYFAAMALQSYMYWALNQQALKEDNKKKASARYARVAYEIADAMIFHRKNN